MSGYDPGAMVARIRKLESQNDTLRAERASQSRHCPECVRLEAKVEAVQIAFNDMQDAGAENLTEAFAIIEARESTIDRVRAVLDGESIVPVCLIRAALTPPEEP